jgi:hypothetical protein
LVLAAAAVATQITQQMRLEAAAVLFLFLQILLLFRVQLFTLLLGQEGQEGPLLINRAETAETFG